MITKLVSLLSYNGDFHFSSVGLTMGQLTSNEKKQIACSEDDVFC